MTIPTPGPKKTFAERWIGWHWLGAGTILAIVAVALAIAFWPAQEESGSGTGTDTKETGSEVPATSQLPASRPSTSPIGSNREYDVESLIDMFGSLKGWCDTEPSESDWARAIVVARIVQRTDPEIVSQAIDAFCHDAWARDRNSPDYNCDPGSEVMLLLRIVFEFPDEALGNSAWPVSWSGGKPHLVELFSGRMAGFQYGAHEYRMFVSEYPMRNLDAVPGEFDTNERGRGTSDQRD